MDDIIARIKERVEIVDLVEQAGLHVVAATLHPELAAGAFEVRICGPLSDPGDLVLALGTMTLDEAQDLARVEDVHWLNVWGNILGFRPEVG